MKIYCNYCWTSANDSSEHGKRIHAGRQLWLTFKEISIYRRYKWVCLPLPPHTLRVNIVKAVASFLYIVASISGGVDDAGPEQAERDDSAHRGRFLPLWVHTEAAIRLFVSVVPSWVSGSHPYAPAYWIGRKQEVDSAREGRCFTHLWPVLSCYSPCLYLIIAHAWALDT